MLAVQRYLAECLPLPQLFTGRGGGWACCAKSHAALHIVPYGRRVRKTLSVGILCGC